MRNTTLLALACVLLFILSLRLRFLSFEKHTTLFHHNAIIHYDPTNQAELPLSERLTEKEKIENDHDGQDGPGNHTCSKVSTVNMSSLEMHYNAIRNIKLKKCFDNSRPRIAFNVCLRKCAGDYFLYRTDTKLNESTLFPICTFVKTSLYALTLPHYHNLSLAGMICPDGTPSTSIRYLNASAHLLSSVKVANVFFHTMTVFHSYLTLSNDYYPQNPSKRPNIEYLVEGFNEKSTQYNDLYQRLILKTNYTDRIIRPKYETICFDRLYIGFQFFAKVTSILAYVGNSQQLATRIPTARNTIASAFRIRTHPITYINRVCVLSRQTKQTIRGRIMLNEQALLHTIQMNHYQAKRIFIIQSATLDRTAHSLNSCHALIAVHGAGLANIIFLRPKALIIEIFPWNFHKPVYSSLAQIFDLNYHQVRLLQNSSIPTDISKRPRKDPRDQYRMRNVIADIDAIMKILNQGLKI